MVEPRPAAGRRGLRRLVTWGLAAALAMPLGLLSADASTLAAGYKDHRYATSIKTATADKPQSKLWYADGRWWGVLWDSAAGKHTIHGFNLATQATKAWTSTGVVVDVRPNSQSDALWDAQDQKLYVVSHLKASDTSTQDKGLWFERFGYSDGVYSVEVRRSLVNVRLENAVLDRDSTGTVWVTYAQRTKAGRYVKVLHTTTDDSTWTAPFVLPVSSTATLTDVDDISTLVAYRDGEGPKIGVLWSNQKTSSLYFASHLDGAPDSAWNMTELCRAAYCPDDHLNIKSVDADVSGNVYAVVKTSNNDKSPIVPSDPLVVVYRLNPSGSWTSSTAWTVGEGNVTRPILLLDTERRRVLTFAAGPCCRGGSIYMKEASFDTLDFARGTGTVVLRSAVSTERINNPTSTKQSVTSATGVLVVASIQYTHEYVHAFLPLGGG